jgi:hypothetical protein
MKYSKIMLKKSVAVIVFILGLFSTQIVKSQIQFGVKGGLNVTDLNIYGPNVTSGIKAGIDFNAGILANIQVSESFFIQPEVVYSAQGGSVKDSSGTLKYDYINVPVLLQYHLSSGLFFESGPQLGFLLSSNYNTEHLNLNVKDQSKTTDFSWAFGVGYKFTGINLGLDLRYNLGITNTSLVNGFVVKNSVFQFGVFYLF